ncbi:hypothetical protein ACGFRB_29615 [Streptomyces sp. NPDC048718]|uniref:hypothetical protein n=1 Tax=Streptomyces sp. NPDC048718 TaxID=3365587 RepID=UPI0037140E24
MKLRIAALAGVAGLTGMLALAGPAQATEVVPTVKAATAINGDYCIEAAGGIACFQAYGDKFIMGDYKADGLRVIADWETDYGRLGECHHTGGAGSTGVCNYDMREDGKVRFRLVLRDGATGPNAYTTAWSPWILIS